MAHVLIFLMGKNLVRFTAATGWLGLIWKLNDNTLEDVGRNGWKMIKVSLLIRFCKIHPSPNHLQQYSLLIRNIISICVAVYTSAAPDYLDV